MHPDAYRDPNSPYLSAWERRFVLHGRHVYALNPEHADSDAETIQGNPTDVHMATETARIDSGSQPGRHDDLDLVAHPDSDTEILAMPVGTRDADLDPGP